MLKVALYGNTIDFHIFKKLVSNLDTIKLFIDRFDEIYRGDGIKKLTENAFKKLSQERQKRVRSFNEISDIPILETEHIDEYYSVVHDCNLPQKEDLRVKSGEHIELYIGERVVFKARPKDESRIVVSYVDQDSVYREKTLGISTEKRLEALKVLYGIFISKLYTYYQFLTTSSWGVFFSEILQFEYLMFPYVEIQDKEEFVNLVNQFIAYYKGLQNTSPDELLEQINEMVNEAYGVNELEKDLIDYVLNVSRYQFQESKLQRLIRPPRNDELKQYAQVFYRHFNDIYNNNNEYFQICIYRVDYFVAIKFNIVDSLPLAEETIIFPQHDYTEQTMLLFIIPRIVSIDELSKKIFVQKDKKGFEEDFFYIIKPNEYKCWHRAMAHYDLAEFVEKIEEAESKELMENINE